MALSRRGFFKGVAALFAGAVAAQLPSCTTGPAPLAVAEAEAPNEVSLATLKRVSSELNKNATPLDPNERWIFPQTLRRFKGEILAHAVPTEVRFPSILTATEVEENQRIERTYIAKRVLPHSPDPLIEGITPTPDALLERGQPVG